MSSLDIGILTSRGSELLEAFVQKNGLDGAVIATAEGLEMASYFKSDIDSDIVAADMASLLASTTSVLDNTDTGTLSEMIISADNGAIAVKDLGEEVALGVLAPAGFKMGGLVVALKVFIKELQAL
jgi:predicted regulator of Ras-like GTPase activity (Roadblock/LC7/MglB family)